MRNLKFAALIPAYNEEKNLPHLLSRLPCEKKNIIVVDDGSNDSTAAVAAKCGVTVLRQEKNLGKGAAQRRGFEYLKDEPYDGVITIDADGQHDPALIPQFLKKARDGNYDIVIGARMLEPTTSMPLIRLLTNLTTSLVVSLMSGQRIRDSQSGYRYLSARVIRNIPLTTSRYQTESEVLIKAGRQGYRIGEMPISTIYSGQKSNINKFTDTLRFIGLSIKSLWW
ncbi:glycosyltransferase family 2 protein [candidate division TA06 bacterium]|uniref:Glycosyltransferase family 2 protein n=1 Tax=candidate division TA06 bacterium TaxID=2250710 RepID=A0A523XHC9_UNCT6|nr:MAG: glycosyltransferase family 2 protein [candidate division TA06 bacterium]